MIDLKLRRSPEESADLYATGALVTCPVCEAVMGNGYPLWGTHLQAAIALHAAHRAVTDLRDVPALTETDRRFGRRLGLVEP